MKELGGLGLLITINSRHKSVGSEWHLDKAWFRGFWDFFESEGERLFLSEIGSRKPHRGDMR